MARGKESVVVRKRHPMLIRLLFKIETEYKNIKINSKKKHLVKYTIVVTISNIKA